MPREKEKLPEANKITIELKLEDAKACLKSLPPNLEKLADKIKEGIEEAAFWNFLRECKYLECARADFHFTGLSSPAWHLYCKHPENKSKAYVVEIVEEKDKITGHCDRKSCPVYKASFLE